MRNYTYQNLLKLCLFFGFALLTGKGFGQEVFDHQTYFDDDQWVDKISSYMDKQRNTHIVWTEDETGVVFYTFFDHNTKEFHTKEIIISINFETILRPSMVIADNGTVHIALTIEGTDDNNYIFLVEGQGGISPNFNVTQFAPNEIAAQNVRNRQPAQIGLENGQLVMVYYAQSEATGLFANNNRRTFHGTRQANGTWDVKYTYRYGGFLSGGRLAIPKTSSSLEYMVIDNGGSGNPRLYHVGTDDVQHVEDIGLNNANNLIYTNDGELHLVGHASIGGNAFYYSKIGSNGILSYTTPIEFNSFESTLGTVDPVTKRIMYSIDGSVTQDRSPALFSVVTSATTKDDYELFQRDDFDAATQVDNISTYNDFVSIVFYHDRGKGLAVVEGQFVSNNAPTDISLSNNTIAENQPSGTVVGIFTTTDADSNDSHSYTLVSGSGSSGNSSFTIEGNELKTAQAFSGANSYNIRVETTDALGASFVKIFTINVTASTSPSPIASFTQSTTIIEAGQSVTFTNTSTNATSVQWGFEGGSPSTSTSNSPTVTYNTAGTHNVTLTASNGTNSDVATGTVTVQSSNTGGGDDSECLPATWQLSDSDGIINLTFNYQNDRLNNIRASASDIPAFDFIRNIQYNSQGYVSQYQFDNTDEVYTITNTYNNQGRITKLVSSGGEDAVEQNFFYNSSGLISRVTSVYAFAPNEEYTEEIQYSGTNPTSIKLTDPDDFSYQTDFSGYDSKEFAFNGLQKFFGTGNYIPNFLTNMYLGQIDGVDEAEPFFPTNNPSRTSYSDDDGDTFVQNLQYEFNNQNYPISISDEFSTSTITYTCSSSQPTTNPVASFTQSTTTIETGQSVAFTNTSTNATSVQWSFEGGSPSSSTSNSPTITYNTAGTYNITLTASNGSNSDVATGTVTVKSSNTGSGGDDESTLIFEDNFNNNSNGWSTTSDDEKTFSISGGRFNIENRVENCWSTSNVAPFEGVNFNDNFVIETSMTWESGTNERIYGLSFVPMLGSRANERHVLGISADGWYIIFYWNTEGSFTTKKDWTQSSFVNINGTNKLVIERKNEIFNYYINGSLVYSETAFSGDNIRVGYTACNIQTVSADYLRVFQGFQGTNTQCPNITPTIETRNWFLTSSVEGTSYKWTVNNEPARNPEGQEQTGREIVAFDAGIYIVEVTDANGCVYTSNPFTVSITGVNVEALSKSILVYPNPSNGIFKMNLGTLKANEVELSVLNLLGQEVERSIAVMGTHEAEITLNGLAEGLYFIKISVQDFTIHKRILLEK